MFSELPPTSSQLSTITTRITHLPTPDSSTTTPELGLSSLLCSSCHPYLHPLPCSRGFPDISANGAYYIVSVNGAFYQVFGTSASAPTIASMIVLINNARAGVGKAPVGFINPAVSRFGQKIFNFYSFSTCAALLFRFRQFDHSHCDRKQCWMWNSWIHVSARLEPQYRTSCLLLTTLATFR